MDWIHTPESSTIQQFCYYANSQILKVEFKNGTTYDYFDVPEHVFETMRNAGSKGQFLAQHLKGSYRYARC
jgi:hypothetical protein